METGGMAFDWTEGPLAQGLRLYDAGDFFRAHEEWESVWLTSQEPEKTFLQGLIQVTAAFHHLQRNNPLGTTRLLHAALSRLEAYPENFGGLSLALLRQDIRDRLISLEVGQSSAELVRARIEPC
jgi:uncharacterized protein